MIHLIKTINGKTVTHVKDFSLLQDFSYCTVMTTDFIVRAKTRDSIQVNGQLLGYTYRFRERNIISIDHHSSDQRMQRHVSSTNLALEYVKAFGPSSHTVITHTDYDSVVAASILTGRLSLNLGFLLGPAAIAADHTGEENVFADTLQSIQELRNIDFSLFCLEILLHQGEEALPEIASQALQSRRKQRKNIEYFVQKGNFKHRDNGVYVAYFDTKIDGELLPSLLPDAKIIITISPHQKEEDGVIIKTRLGLAAPEGMSLLNFDLPGWGGRWNAGSTGRHGGTKDPEQFIECVCRNL